MIRSRYRKRLGIVFGGVLLLGFAVFAFSNGLPGAGKIERATPESAEFTHKMQQYVIENLGQPIEGFDAALYLQAFPGLTEADFDGVETMEGAYVYADGALTFMRTQTGRTSSAEEAITERGHATLFAALRKRLGNILSVEKIIARITDDAGTPLVSEGDILGAMTVVSAKPFNSGQYSADPKMMKMGPRNIQIILKGPIEVTGTYEAVHSGIGFDGYCMSDFDAVSLSRMPSLPVRGGPADTRSRFCFRNGDFAKQILGEESRRITVTIDHYELNSYPAEVVDWADVVDIVRR
jgi:hypothetical protein